MQETRVQSLGWENPLEEEMATHSSILDWKIPWTKEPSEYSPWVGRVRYNWACVHAQTKKLLFSSKWNRIIQTHFSNSNSRRRTSQSTWLLCKPLSAGFFDTVWTHSELSIAAARLLFFSWAKIKVTDSKKLSRWDITKLYNWRTKLAFEVR